jgi:hypothetical protein
VPFAPAPDLARENRFVAPWDFIWGDAEPIDLDGHGTHVAGTIGQLTKNGIGAAGMAFNARLMPIKVIAGDWDQIYDTRQQALREILHSTRQRVERERSQTDAAIERLLTPDQRQHYRERCANLESSVLIRPTGPLLSGQVPAPPQVASAMCRE